jgi:microsomal dipeptidase-like Zn-dependent dipeptidase
MYELVAALVRRGYTDEQIRLVIGGNWARVLGQIWQG